MRSVILFLLMVAPAYGQEFWAHNRQSAFFQVFDKLPPEPEKKAEQLLRLALGNPEARGAWTLDKVHPDPIAYKGEKWLRVEYTTRHGKQDIAIRFDAKGVEYLPTKLLLTTKAWAAKKGKEELAARVAVFLEEGATIDEAYPVAIVVAEPKSTWYRCRWSDRSGKPHDECFNFLPFGFGCGRMDTRSLEQERSAKRSQFIEVSSPDEYNRQRMSISAKG